MEHWFDTLKAALRSMSVDELTEIAGVGAVVAESIATAFSTGSAGTSLEDLLDAGVVVVPAGASAADSDGPLAGQVVVVTGTLAATGWSRREAQERIAAAGGAVADSVTAKTTLIVAGEKAGSKRAAAVRLGIRIVDEAEFVELLGG